MDARKKAKLEALENGANDFSFASPTYNGLPHTAQDETPEALSRPFTGSFSGLDMLVKWSVNHGQSFVPDLADSLCVYSVDRVSKRIHERATSPEDDEADTPVVRVLGETSLTHFFAQLQPSEDLQLAARQFGLAHRHDGSIQTGGGGGTAVHRAHGELTTELVLDRA